MRIKRYGTIERNRPMVVYNGRIFRPPFTLDIGRPAKVRLAGLMLFDGSVTVFRKGNVEIETNSEPAIYSRPSGRQVIELE